MTEKIAGEPCLEHAYRVQLTSGTIQSFSNVLVQSSGGSRPRDRGGGGSSRPRDNGWPGLKKNFSPPFGSYFRLKIRGGGGVAGSPGPSAGSAAAVSGKPTKAVVWTRSMRFR